MAWYHLAQLAAFAIVAVLAWKTPRGALWVAALAASYVISVLYLHLSPGNWYWPPSQLVGLFLDGAVLLLIRERHTEKWEYFGLGTIMAFMVTADIIQLFGVLTGFPPPLTKGNFGVILECLNYLALALIGGVGTLDRMPADNEHGVATDRFNLLSRAGHYAHARTHAPKPLQKW